MIKICGHKSEHQSKTKNLFETIITLKKAKTKKSCILFLNQFNIKK
jgi:hypothetical protein